MLKDQFTTTESILLQVTRVDLTELISFHLGDSDIHSGFHIQSPGSYL